MAINSLNETKTLHQVADFLGVKLGANKPAPPAGGQAGDKDKIEDPEHRGNYGQVPTPSASGF